MHKKHLASYITRYLMLAILLLVASMSSMFALTNHLSQAMLRATNREELQQAIEVADKQFGRYNRGEITRSQLRQLVNPVINTSDVFLMLLDKERQVVTYTEAGAPFFAGDKLSGFLDRFDKGKSYFTPDTKNKGTVILLAQETENGMVFAGMPSHLVTVQANTFRMKLVIWLVPLIFLVCVIWVFTSRLFAKPVNVLTEAAAQLTKGETVMLDEDLPGEVGELAQAFNRMSSTISHTIAELNNEKETMSMVLQSLDEGILAIGLSGEIIHENPAAVRLLGDTDTVAYKTVLNALKTALHTDGNIQGKIPKGDITLDYTISHLPSENKLGGVIALIRDITEQERLERTRYDYVANISHELRTPLTNMRGLAEGLRDGLVTDENDKMRYYGIIVDEVKRLSRLVNDLLELSGLQSNPAAFEMEKVAPTELMWELYDLNKRPFAQKNQTFRLDIPEDELPEIITNEDRLSEVLTILMDNARKYTNEGGTIVLGAAPDISDGLVTGVRFYVRDNGIGMDEETQALAFDRFHQAEKSHADKGSGLGLSIAREILQKMNVSISLKSKLGEGSEFSFILPVP